MRISDWSSDVCSSDLADFDTVPLASASIAQVHAATLRAESDAPRREVVVKVLRPGIERQIAADIALLKNIAGLVDRTHPSADKIRPREIVAEIESTLAAELDLPREGANRPEEHTSALPSLMRTST